LIFVSFSSMAIFSLIGLKLTPVIFNIDALSLLSPDYASMDSNSINAIKFLNLFITIGTFLVPALIIPQILRKNTSEYLTLNKPVEWKFLLYCLVLFVVIYPFLDWTISLNQGMQFPSFMEDLGNKLKMQDDSIQVLTSRFLEMGNIQGLIINLVVIAFIPAFIEELFFRGLIQNIVTKWLKNIHISIIFTAIFFAAIHMEFLGILPRIILGLILGYIFYWSGSIWSSVFFHFLNNATAVVLVFLSQKSLINYKIDEPMHSSNIVTIISFGIAAIICLYLANRYNKRRDKKDDWVKVYESQRMSDAEIVKGNLEENNIEAAILNKKDFTHLTIGYVEVLVKPVDEEAAKKLITTKQVVDEDETE
jgi:uncharacterized protein